MDKKIELNRKKICVFEDFICQIYKYWFIQFEFPNNEKKNYKSNNGVLEYNPILKKNIPIGWKVESLINNSISKPIKPGVEKFDTKTYFATADVNKTKILNGKTIEFTKRENRANMQPTINSVWFAKMKKSVKHLFLNKGMEEFISSSILSTGFFGIQCESYSFEYIASFIEDTQFEVQKDKVAHGATQEAVNTDDLSRIMLLIPPISVLQKYNKLVGPIYNMISNLIIENRKLILQRDYLLPLLINGQVKICEKAHLNE